MTDSQYGFRNPQELPEVPYRAQTPQQPAVQGSADGVDVSGEIPYTSPYNPVPSSDSTESFATAQRGDTETMPTAASPAVGTPIQQGGGYASQQPSVQPVGYGYSRQQASSQVMLEGGYASQPSQAYEQRGNGYTSHQRSANPAPSAVQAQPVARQAEPRKSGAGKSFLFGFLGALLACILTLGGFAFAGGFKDVTPTVGSSTTIGSQNQSVINAAEEGQTLAEAVAEKTLPSVVAIYNYQNQSASYGYGFGYGYGASNQSDDSLIATGMGSGVVISDDGYIITNYHVVENAAKLTVSVNGVEREATYVGGDSSSDIAVVKVEDTEGLVSADIGDSDSLRIGEWVMTVGAPLGLESSVATGVVSATNRSTIMDSSSSNDMYSYFYGSSTPEYTYYPNMIQTDAVINPGNSGGALVDADGKLIGINAMISSYSGDYAGVGFAIPINYAISLAQDIINGKEPTHAMIGVSLSQVNSQIAQQYNLSTNSGGYIAAITPGSGAADSDLQVGDIITKVDGKSVSSPTDITLEVRAHKVGDTIAITVNRGGEVMDIDVTLTSDENVSSTSNQESQQDQQQEQGMGQDPWGDGRGDGGGYSRDDIERLLELLGH